jgi:ketosteroid isomerase-like protein
MASTQSEVSALLDSRSEAIRVKDINRLMSFYSPDIVYFDLVPGLQYIGSAALRPRFLQWFDGYKGSIRQEIRDLNILASGDIAVAYMLIRAGGTLKNGHEVGFWVRATSCCQRSNHRWLILRAGVRPWTLRPNLTFSGSHRASPFGVSRLRTLRLTQSSLATR